MTAVEVGTGSWLTPFLVALLASGILALPILRLLISMKSRQTVSQYVPEHAKKQGTPTMGGIIIAVGFLAGMVFAIAGPSLDAGVRSYLTGFVAVFIAFTFIGFVDDYVVPRLLKGKRGLGWTQKLVLQVLAALLMFGLGGFSASPSQMAVGVFIVLFFSNAYNFSDGLDALAGSLLVALCLGLAAIALQLRFGEMLIPLSALIAGAIPFLWLNRPPARVFMGDVGSLPIGATLGLTVSTLLLPDWRPHWVGLGEYETTNYAVVEWPIWVGIAVISFVMLAELIPVPLQILSVKLRKKRIFPATPIHHSFEKAGWKEGRIVATFVAVQLVCSIFGVLMASFGMAALDDVKKDADLQHLQDLKRSLQP